MVIAGSDARFDKRERERGVGVSVGVGETKR